MARSTITFVKRPTLYAYNEKTGEEVFVGNIVKTSDGEIARVTTLSRATIPGKSGKVVVRWIETTSGPTDYEQEYYDGVFGLVVTDVPPGEYDVYTLDNQGTGHLYKRNVKAHNVIRVMADGMMKREHWEGGDFHPSK